MDPLTDIVALLRPHAVFSKPITGRGRWGVRYAAYESPSFCIVLEGQCWLTIEGEAPRVLERGDFLLLPFTPAFTLGSEPGVECVPGVPSETGVHHGDPEGAPDFRMIGGTFQIEPVNAALLGLVSGKIHIRAAECDTSRLTRIVDLIMDEYTAGRPGRDMILERFLEVMLVESLRWPGLSHESVPAGLIAGLLDAPMAAALRAMHSDVRHGWTVAELAKHAGMSRSAFATRFATTMGCAPMEYLSRWRMSLAQDALSRGGKSLDRLAEEIGYESASAFSTAFRRRLGCAPGAFARRARRQASMDFREATMGDIEEMHRIRMEVTENMLSDPAKIKLSAYEDFIRSPGKGWVCQVEGRIRGFGFINSSNGNLWALFVEPGYEKLGIGRRLHDQMLEWAFAGGQNRLWLTTDAGTRAESFYRRAGWREVGRTPGGEIRFELGRKNSLL